MEKILPNSEELKSLQAIAEILSKHTVKEVNLIYDSLGEHIKISLNTLSFPKIDPSGTVTAIV